MSGKRRSRPADPEIARRLRIVLRAHGLTQSALAAMLRIEVASVSQWLSGTTVPREQRFHQIAEALGEDPDWLMGKSATGKWGLGAHLARFLEALGPERMDVPEKLPEQDWRELAAMAERLALRKTLPPRDEEA